MSFDSPHGSSLKIAKSTYNYFVQFDYKNAYPSLFPLDLFEL